MTESVQEAEFVNCDLKVQDLIPYANNSRLHSDEQVLQIAASIKEFGFTNPVIVDENMGIIAGHGRIMAANKLGWDLVPCRQVSGWSEAKKKAYVIADNQLPLNAEWSEVLLKLEMQALDEMGYKKLEVIGFDADRLKELLAQEEEENPNDPDECPATSVDTTSVPGDIWQLGKHRLMCGDSTSIDAVEKLCDGQLIDLLVTDPPYNVAYEGKTKDALTIENDEMSDSDFRQFLSDAYTAADAVMKAGAVFYIWHADSEGFNFRGAAIDVGWKVRQCLIWEKQTMVMGRQDYHWQHEPCLYGWKEGAAHLWASDRKQTTLLRFNRPSRNAEHPTMKPVDLIEYQILNNTKGDDLVLDLFGGSGTTMIAAEKNGRRSCLMELDPVYCDVIIKRWQVYTGQEAVHIESGRKFNDMVDDCGEEEA